MAGCQASFGSPTKCRLRPPAGGTPLCRMAELESPFCLGPWETRGGDSGHHRVKDLHDFPGHPLDAEADMVVRVFGH